MLCILWLIGKALFDYFRWLKPGGVAPAARFVLYGAIAVILAILAEGSFEYNLSDSEVLTMFLTTIACGYSAGLATTSDARLSSRYHDHAGDARCLS